MTKAKLTEDLHGWKSCFQYLLSGSSLLDIRPPYPFRELNIQKSEFIGYNIKALLRHPFLETGLGYLEI